jgi:hypothetical protein
MAINEKDPRVIAMRKQKYSDAQIEEMLEDDKAVDRGEPLPWDMTPEEHKKAMKYANVDEHKKPAKPTEKKAPTVYNWDTTDKPKKQNITKEGLVSALAQFLRDNAELACEGVEITNKQGKVEFTVNGTAFTFSLTQHRKK